MRRWRAGSVPDVGVGTLEDEETVAGGVSDNAPTWIRRLTLAALICTFMVEK